MSHVLVVEYSEKHQEYRCEIECDKVTDECAEWRECTVPGCPIKTDNDDYDDPFTLYENHGELHQFFDYWNGDFWATETNECYAVNSGQIAAEDFAYDNQLDSGRYPVNVEVDDGSIFIDLVKEK